MSRHVTPAAPRVAVEHDPLCWFAASSDTYLGAADLVEPHQLPEPYGSLLVHEGSMTERLETHFGGRASLEILSLFASADLYARWILLLDSRGRCLELGGVCLDLRLLSASLRADILDGELPLGRLLSRHGLAYASMPQSFLSIDVSPRVHDLLQMTEPRRVFGRRTCLQAGGQTLGDIVEVLPCYDVQSSRRP